MIWVDAQLSPKIATWIEATFNVPCKAVRDLGLRDAADIDIFQKAKQANTIVITKDKDFVELLYRYKSPPKIIWLTCGNTSNEILKKLMTLHLKQALNILKSGNDIVEIN